MSEFSNMANYYVQHKNIKVSSMAQHCSTDRSTMYKLLNDKRNPPSQQLVEKMAEYMELTPMEKNELIEAYKVTVTGPNIYYRRKNILDLFVNYPEKELRSDLTHPAVSTCAPLADFQGTDTDLAVESKANIQRLLYQILLRESQRASGMIQIIAQPSWTYLLELLQVLGYNHDDLEIQHIICMSNNIKANYKYQDYNIAYLQQILPLFQSDVCYRPRYYYDNIDSHFHNLSMMPYWIITSEYALNCSFDIQYAILYRNPGTIHMLKSMFQQQYQRTSVLFKKLSDAGTDFISLMQDSFTPDCTYSINAWPCIIPALSKEIYDAYIIPDVPDRPQFIEYLTQYSQQVKERHQSNLLADYFTKKGITSFMSTGRISSLPANLYTPIRMADRKKILNYIIENTAMGHSFLLTGEAEVLPMNINCLINSKTGILMTTSTENNFIYLILEEKNTFDSFLDCLTHLNDMEVIADRETALKFLRDLARKF